MLACPFLYYYCYFLIGTWLFVFLFFFSLYIFDSSQHYKQQTLHTHERCFEMCVYSVFLERFFFFIYIFFYI